MWQERDMESFQDSPRIVPAQSIPKVPVFHIKNFKKLRYNRKRSLSNSQPLDTVSSFQAQKPTQSKVHEMEKNWQKLKPKLSQRSKSNGTHKKSINNIQGQFSHLTSSYIPAQMTCSTTRNVEPELSDPDEIESVGTDDENGGSPKINKIRVFENFGAGNNKIPSHRCLFNSTKNPLDLSAENVSPVAQGKPSVPNATDRGAVNSRKSNVTSSVDSNTGFSLFLVNAEETKEQQPLGRPRSTSKWQAGPMIKRLVNKKLATTIETSITLPEAAATTRNNNAKAVPTIRADLTMKKQTVPVSARANHAQKSLDKENLSQKSNGVSTKTYGTLLKKGKIEKRLEKSKVPARRHTETTRIESQIENIQEEPEKENDEPVFDIAFNIDTVLSDKARVKDFLKRKYVGPSMDAAMQKLYEAALAQKYALIQFEKVRAEIMANCIEPGKCGKGSSRNVQQISKMRPESCAKMRNSLTKTLTILKNSAKDKRSTSTMKGKLVAI